MKENSHPKDESGAFAAEDTGLEHNPAKSLGSKAVQPTIDPLAQDSKTGQDTAAERSKQLGGPAVVGSQRLTKGDAQEPDSKQNGDTTPAVQEQSRFIAEESHHDPAKHQEASDRLNLDTDHLPKQTK